MSDNPDRAVLRNQGPIRQAPKRDAQPRTEDDINTGLPAALAEDRGATPPREEVGRKDSDDPYGYYAERGGRGRISGASNAIGLLEVARTSLRPGWDCQYITVSIYNQPVEGAQIRAAMDGGWVPAKAGDFPNEVLPGTKPDAPVINYGQQLFIRPEHMTEEAKREEYMKARAAQERRTMQSAQGQSVKAGDRAEEETIGNMNPNVVRPVSLGVNIEGEYGTWGGRGRQK